MYIINVIPITKIPMPSPQILSYFYAEILKRGALVDILLNKREVRGLVLDSSSLEKEKIKIKRADFKIRNIEKIITSEPIISENNLKLAIWMHKYYFSPLGLILKTMLPSYLLKRKNLDNATKQDFVALKERKRSQGKPLLLVGENLEKEYLKKIKTLLKSKKQALFLVPEISLINKYERVLKKISKGISIIHGNLTEKQLFNEWQRIKEGKSKIVLGTRRAVFVDFYALGLIIVDHEESSSHGSWDQQPRYNARDVALRLGEITGAEVVLGSNMPSLESYHKVGRGKYRLKGVRGVRGVRASECQSIGVIDMREEMKSGNFSIFSRELQSSLKKIINSGEQAILFINRRGLATCILCRDCGYVAKCPNCEVPFVYHENISCKTKTKSYSLICHHCGAMAEVPILCPNCKGHRIKFFGTGTQKVAEEFRKLFPKVHPVRKNEARKDEASQPTSLSNGVKFLRLDSDVASKPEDQEKIFKEFSKKKVQALIGTQLLLKKHLLPKVALVGIVSVETMLNMPDFRSGERAFRLINLLGQLGKDKVLIQSYNPENYIFRYLKNQESRIMNQGLNSFYKEELKLRKEFSWPPFSQIVKLTFQHKDLEKAKNEALILKEKLKIQLKHLVSNFDPFDKSLGSPRAKSRGDIRISPPEASLARGGDFEILGPAPAFIPKIRGKYIHHMVVKIRNPKSEIRNIDLGLRNRLLSIVPGYWIIDVDPETIL